VTRNVEDWRQPHRNNRLTIEAGMAAQPAWFRRPVFIIALAGAIVALAAAFIIGGSGAGIDPTTTGAVDTVDPTLAGMPQFDSM
jgi:hypothetical protein